MSQTQLNEKIFDILIVEDNPADVILVEEALKELKIKVRLHALDDGVKALDYLYRKEPYANASVPDLIILDVNLPRGNGLGVLREVKNDPKLKGIPVVVLTSSRSEKHMLMAYGFGETLFIGKPLGFYQFMGCVKTITSSLLGHAGESGAAEAPAQPG